MSTAKSIIVVGASFAGLKCAWELRHRLPDSCRITLLSNKPKTIFRASFPHVIFGETKIDQLTLDLAASFAGTGIDFHCEPLMRIDQANNKIITTQGERDYDFLVLATGVRHAYELIPGSREHCLTICDPDRLQETKEAIDRFTGGIIYAGVGAGYTPCDGPQFEVLMNLDHRLRQKGLRQKTELHYITDKERLLPPAGPRGWEYLTKLFRQHEINVHLDTYLTSVEADRLHFKDGTIKPFDLCVLVPPYRGIKALEDSGLTDERGFVPVSPTTMRASQSTNYNIYAIGDGNALPGPKQGHLALMQAQIAAEHLAWRINQSGTVRAYLPEFKCVMDMGDDRGLYIYSQYMSDGDIIEIKEGNEPYRSKLEFEHQWLAKKGDIGELHHQIMK